LPARPQPEARAGAMYGGLNQQMAPVLDPAGRFASSVATLSWVLFALGLAVLLIVVAAMWIAVRGGPAWRRRLASERTVVGLGVVFPAIVLTGLLVWGLTLTSGLTRPAADAATVRITGQQWWWRVAYLEGDQEAVVEANELHIPTGRTVAVELKARDVIHSFWIPRLSGKLDMIPGRTNLLRLHADRPGVYRGQCAEYCGGAHALMAFTVVAHAPADYAAWLEARRRPAAPPADAVAAHGRRVFLAHDCSSCHTVRGLPAIGDLGPDLTHVGSRGSLAAGTLPNSEAGFGGWISGNQAIKPGARMPQYRMAGADLHALAVYLEGLK